MAERERHVVLIGMMGAGKTKVGRVVAEMLARPFFDSDEVIEARTGRSVRSIFEEDGEALFRAIEAGVIGELLTSSDPSVIAAGGGAVLDPNTRDRLSSKATVVWLRGEPSLLAERLSRSNGAHRPLLDGHEISVYDRIVEIMATRASTYELVADQVIDIDDRPASDTAQSVIEVLV